MTAHESNRSARRTRFRAWMRAVICAVICASVATLGAALAAVPQAGPPAGAGPRAADWGARDPARLARVLEAELGGGTAAARRALDGFRDAHVAERRLRARILRTEAGADEWDPILELVADPDGGVRVEIARALGRPDRAEERVADRARALTRLADGDPDAEVRAVARTGLATLAAVAELSRLADRAPRSERAALLNALSTRPEARAELLRRLLGTDDEELALAARIVAEEPGGAAEERVLAAIAEGLARDSAGAIYALERCVRRLVQLGAAERASSLLSRFDHPAAYELRARLALTRAHDPAQALAAARALAESRTAHESAADAVRRRSRAARYAACARAAAGDDPEWESSGELARARVALDAELAQRADRSGPTGVDEHVALLEERAQVELCDAVCSLAATADPDPARAVDASFALQAVLLRAQAVATRAELGAADGLDPVLGGDDSAVELVLDGDAIGVLDPARQLAIRLALGRALATAAASELVGFEPLPEFAADPRLAVRRAWLEEVLRADLDRAQARHARASLAVERARSTRPGGAPAAARQEELESRLILQGAWDDLAKLAQGDDEPLADTRSASWFAVTSARRLRDAGRGPEARALLGRARADLEASGAAQRWLWGIELVAELEAATGASFSDDEEPARAEVELLRAVERLRALEELLRERGAPPRALDAVRNQRASALVSLAVNANVRLHQPEQALEHFEAAWELRQDEFSRVLLACYRARSGRAAEARALLATVAPGPGTYYNLACTWALLGDRDAAFHWLALELRENHAPGGSLERQQAWARKDPDLESLRGDARFVELVGK